MIDLPTALVCWALAAALVALAARHLVLDTTEDRLPLAGIVAAFIFAAQTINFPIPGGTSGHVLGGALAAVLVGPWAGMLAMTAVIGVQALLFQDGGLVAMGANILDMGLVTTAIGFGLYRAVAARSWRMQQAVAAVAAWLSVLAAAFLASTELLASGTVAPAVVLPAMLGVHAIIGLGEAAITVAAISFVRRTRPEVLSPGEVRARGGRGWVVAGLALAAGVVLTAPLASAAPDGLDSVAARLGLESAGGIVPTVPSVLPDYTVPPLGESALSTIAAGAVGLAVVAVAVIAAGRVLRRVRAAWG